MKRIIYIIAMLTMCIMLMCPITTSAEELDVSVPAPDEITSGEVTLDEGVDAIVGELTVIEEEEEKHNIFTRLYEAFCDNKTEVFTLGGSTILLILSIILKKDLGSSSKKIVSGISSVLSKSDLSSERQEAIVVGLNEMIDGYEEIKQQSTYIKDKILSFESAVERVESSNSEVNTKLTEMFTVLVHLISKEMRQNTELMEVLSTVYTNNEAIPQGIKDFVSLMRTENVKLVQEASQLTNKDSAEGGETV